MYRKRSTRKKSRKRSSRKSRKSRKRSTRKKSRKRSNRKSRKRSTRKKSRKSRKRSSVKKSRKRSTRKKATFGMASPQIEKWQIYTKEGCGYCQKAKETLLMYATKNPNVTVEIIKGVGNPELIQKMKGNSYAYWPKIFLNNKFIGGFSDLEKRLSSK